jgi:broad specificity phosphatase PhoE
MGQLDEPLSTLGEDEARALAEAFRRDGVTFDAAFSLDIRRASRVRELSYVA